jgi:hypothetical protein
VFPCVARGFIAELSFMIEGCRWWRSLAVDGASGKSRGHGPIARKAGSTDDHPHLGGDGPRPVRAGSGLALGSDRSVRSGLQGQARLRVYVHRRLSVCSGCPSATVALGAGGADTYTQRTHPRI